MRLANIEGAQENPLNPYSDNIKQNNLYLTIFNLLDKKLNSIANPPASAAVGKK